MPNQKAIKALFIRSLSCARHGAEGFGVTVNTYLLNAYYIPGTMPEE